ncbi:ankyrin repeat-containing domain protein [Hypoxylon argillaceum]|nr:ankyrin repeat-containing domain protein [Hypoxylon argillaceum]
MNVEGLLALLDAIRQELGRDKQEGCSTSPFLVRLVNLPSPELFNFTALHEAARSDSSACVQILLEASADTNLVFSSGGTPLHIAAFNGFQGVVELLVNNGADVSARGKEGESPMMTACLQGRYSVVEFLSRHDNFLESPVDIRGQNLALYTIMSVAAVEKKLPVWDFILTRGIDPYQLDIWGVCAVHIAMACPAPYLGILLKRRALALEIHNIHWGASQLYSASSWGSNMDRETALAQIARNYRLVKRHLGNSYTRIYSDSLVSGTDSMFYQSAHLGVVEALDNFFALGIDMEWCCCNEARTALIIASANGRLEAVKFLVRKGARLQYESNGRQRSAVSAGRGYQDVISWLLVGRFCDQYKLQASAMYEDKPVHPWSGIMGVPIRVKWEWKQMRNETLLAYARRSEAIRKELIRKGRIEQRDIWTAPDLQGDVQSAGLG